MIKRQCGDCSLCCKLLPIPPLKKLAGVKCEFQRHGKGCIVHGSPRQPNACKVWHCRWLVNDDAGDLSRPDRAGYVIDMLPDEIAISNDETGERQEFIAVQIWVDGDKWKDDDALTAWILRKAEQGFPTLIRYDARKAVGIIAPPLSSDGKWHMSDGTINESMGLWK